MINPYKHPEKIDLNLTNYTLQDILQIIDIPINSLIDKSEEEAFIHINDKIDSLIKKFKNMKLNQFVSFFENIKSNFLKPVDDSNYSQADFLINTQQMYSAPQENSYDLMNGNTPNYNIHHNKKTVNPLYRKTVEKIINIDSKHRKFYNESSSTNFCVVLPSKINNVIEMKLNDLELVNTYYIISDEYFNNYFWMKITTITGSFVYIYIFIDPQSYYEGNLIATINSRFNSLGVGINFNLDLTYQNNGALPDGTGKLIINVTDNRLDNIELNFRAPELTSFITSGAYNKTYPKQQFLYSSKLYQKQDNTDVNIFQSITIDSNIYSSEDINRIYNSLDKTPLENKLGWMFGFRKTLCYIYVDSNSSYGSITSSSVVNFLGSKYFYLVVNDFHSNFNNTLFSSDSKESITTNTFARINQNSPTFSISANSNYQITTIPRSYFGPVTIEKLEIQLYDEYGNIVNLNGSDISMTFKIKSLYSIN